MKKILILLLFISSNINSQNQELIKKAFSDYKTNNFDIVALENGFKGKETIYLKVFFKSNNKGEIFDIKVNEKNKIFESDLTSIINTIPKLNPNEYLDKGEEMKYGLKIYIKLSSSKSLKRKIKKGTISNIEFKILFVKEYFPVKWIELTQDNNTDFINFESIPITQNCKNLTNREEIKNCVSRDIRMHINRKFDISIASEIGVTGKQKVLITFVISKKGQVVNIVAKASREELIEEGIRAINTFPDFYKPGIVKGKPIDVKYTIPIKFYVD
jgi:hypothetical protein